MIHFLILKALLLGFGLVIGGLINSAEARPDPGTFARGHIMRLVVAEAEATTVPPSLALALAKVESDFQAAALSHKGARGVMQIMPRTARQEFGVAADELWQPRLNIQLGLSFLEQLIGRYGGRWDLALSHYNGGSLRGTGAQARPHGYTRRYVQSVLRWQKRYAAQAMLWRDDAAKKAPQDWTPARTVAKPARSVEAEDEAAIDWRLQRRLAMIREAREERRAARAEHKRRRLLRLRRARDHDHAHDRSRDWGHHHDLDDFTHHRHHRLGRRG